MERPKERSREDGERREEKERKAKKDQEICRTRKKK